MSTIPSHIAQAAYNTGKKFRLPFTAILAQWALESGWGKSTLVHKTNNPFNIKGCSGYLVKSCIREVDKLEGSNSQYRVYCTIQDGFDAYGHLIATNSRYAKCVGQTDPQTYFQCMKSGGYATDPQYVSKLMSVHASILKRLPANYNTPAPAATAGGGINFFLLALAVGGGYIFSRMDT